jgi:hypothetical protein
MPNRYLDDLLAVGPTPEPSGARYGFGVRITATRAGTAYGHGGSIPGFRSQLYYFPARCIGIALQINTSSGPANQRIPEYTEELAAELLRLVPAVPDSCPARTR